ncbi:glycosyltransferase [Marinobacter sp. NSM]|uniref:glycosyltransferase n=1 Tax=Marinobacter sp. NSM TaxID=3458004 RepID=UPI004035E867
MKIAFVITALGVGGAEKVVCSLADELSNRGHDVLIIYLKEPVLTLPKSKMIMLKGLGLNSIFRLPIVYFKLRAEIKKFRPDVVHSHLDHANFLARLVRLSIGIPRLITTAHNTKVSSAFRALLYRLTNHISDCFTNVSEEAVASYVSHKVADSRQLIAVHNGINCEDSKYIDSARVNVLNEFGFSEETRLICAVGSFCDQKDYPNLLTAIACLITSMDRVKVVIAGDGPLRNDMEKMANQLGLDDTVFFLGIRRDVNMLLSASDIFVLSSAWEGFPMVVGEAMACQTFVVATDCGGVQEFVGDTGRLVPAKNPTELASALKESLLLPMDTRRRIGVEARRRVQDNFSIESAASRWLELYGR